MGLNQNSTLTERFAFWRKRLRAALETHRACQLRLDALDIEGAQLAAELKEELKYQQLQRKKNRQEARREQPTV